MQDPKKPPPTDAQDEPPIGMLPDGTLNIVDEFDHDSDIEDDDDVDDSD